MPLMFVGIYHHLTRRLINNIHFSFVNTRSVLHQFLGTLQIPTILAMVELQIGDSGLTIAQESFIVHVTSSTVQLCWMSRINDGLLKEKASYVIVSHAYIVTLLTIISNVKEILQRRVASDESKDLK